MSDQEPRKYQLREEKPSTDANRDDANVLTRNLKWSS